ncbi:hypothetical protein HK096_003637, partial [Nowakowskiella sp. JEL0078]
MSFNQEAQRRLGGHYHSHSTSPADPYLTTLPSQYVINSTHIPTTSTQISVPMTPQVSYNLSGVTSLRQQMESRQMTYSPRPMTPVISRAASHQGNQIKYNYSADQADFITSQRSHTSVPVYHNAPVSLPPDLLRSQSLDIDRRLLPNSSIMFNALIDDHSSSSSGESDMDVQTTLAKLGGNALDFTEHEKPT